MSCVSVCVCSRGVLLQRLPDADVAAAADGHPGLRRDALLLHGGEDAELLHRFAGTLKRPPPPSLFLHISSWTNVIKHPFSLTF